MWVFIRLFSHRYICAWKQQSMPHTKKSVSIAANIKCFISHSARSHQQRLRCFEQAFFWFAHVYHHTTSCWVTSCPSLHLPLILLLCHPTTFFCSKFHHGKCVNQSLYIVMDENDAVNERWCLSKTITMLQGKCLLGTRGVCASIRTRKLYVYVVWCGWAIINNNNTSLRHFTLHSFTLCILAGQVPPAATRTCPYILLPCGVYVRTRAWMYHKGGWINGCGQTKTKTLFVRINNGGYYASTFKGGIIVHMQIARVKLAWCASAYVRFPPKYYNDDMHKLKWWSPSFYLKKDPQHSKWRTRHWDLLIVAHWLINGK